MMTLSIEHQCDIRWFHTIGESVFRLRCSLGASGARAAAGLGVEQVAPEDFDRDFIAVVRHTRIRRALASCGNLYALALQLRLVPDTALMPRQQRDLEGLGEVAPVMMLAPRLVRWASNKGHEGSLSNAVKALHDAARGASADPGVVATLSQARVETDMILRASCGAYERYSAGAKETTP